MRQWIAMTKLFLVLLMITGILYPVLLTGIALITFPKQAKGSLIDVKGKVVGSRLIGQAFYQAKYFQGRPSLTHYQTDELSPSQVFLPGSAALSQFETSRQSLWPAFFGPVPDDLLQPSASMLDPHLTKASILKQVPMVAKARKINPLWLTRFVDLFQESHWMESDLVNVLELNIALDQEGY